jgi:hypothetical protein
VKTQGITWHAVTHDADALEAWKSLLLNTMGLTPGMEMDGVTVYFMPNGSSLELYAPQAVPDYGYNDAIAFGFRVEDIEAASSELEAAGCELLGEITRVPEMKYAYRHFKGPDGRVYGLNEQS